MNVEAQMGAAKPNQMVRMSRLLQLEWDMRQIKDAKALDFMAVNDLHKIVPFSTCALFRVSKLRIEAVSGAVQLDRTAPMIVWLQAVSRHCAKKVSKSGPTDVVSDNLPKKLAKDFDNWVPGNLIWVPQISPSGFVDGGFLLMREDSFSEGEKRILGNLAEGFHRARFVLRKGAEPTKSLALRLRRIGVWTAIVALCFAAFIPVNTTVLAPARVVPVDATVLTASLDGVLQEILVPPNSAVKKGQPIAVYAIEELENAVSVAQERVLVAQANYQRAVQQGVTDAKARSEIAALFGRHREAKSELDFAQSRLKRATLFAPADGIAIYNSADDWVGRPVRLGERILSIADPSKLEIDATIGVDDVVLTSEGATAVFYLASSPADPVQTVLNSVGYDSKIDDRGVLGYRSLLSLVEKSASLRLGMTGTVKIDAGEMPFIYQYVRKPLAGFRRFLGV